MPYSIRESGDKYKVVKEDGEVMGTHSTKEEAREQQQALYANEADGTPIRQESAMKTRLMAALLKIANRLDKKGLYYEAGELDKVLKWAEEDIPNDMPDNTSSQYMQPETEMPDNTQERIKNALENTPPDYLSKMLAMRNPGPESQGSVFAEPQTKESLVAASWKPYNHPSIQSPAEGFTAEIPGNIGIVELAKLPDQMPVTLEDPKGTGQLSAVAQISKENMPGTNTSVMILGPHEDQEVVYTVFPGDPIAPSEVSAEEVPEDKRSMTVEEARNLGLEYAKISE